MEYMIIGMLVGCIVYIGLRDRSQEKDYWDLKNSINHAKILAEQAYHRSWKNDVRLDALEFFENYDISSEQRRKHYEGNHRV